MRVGSGRLAACLRQKPACCPAHVVIPVQLQATETGRYGSLHNKLEAVSCIAGNLGTKYGIDIDS